MVVTSQDVVREDDIADIIETQRESTYGFRRAFRDGGTRVGPTVDVDVAPDDLFDQEDYEKVPENAEYPRADPEDFTQLQATVHKRGFEAVVTDEAVSRNQVPQQLDIARNQARTQERTLDAIAGGLLLSNTAATTAGDANGTLSWTDVLDARTQMRDADLEPDLLLVEPYGVGDILADDRISNRSTDMSDQAIREGQIAWVLGIDFFELTTDTPALGQNDALLVDTSRYGYEFDEDLGDLVEPYREESRDRTVYKVRDSRGWLATEGDAAMQIDG
jgi:hypothetical protein